MTTEHESIRPAGNDPFLTALQTGFPIEQRPFAVIGERFGKSERDVIDTIIDYKEEGLIRTFGPVFEPRRLGYVSTLAAAKVVEDRIAELAAAMLDVHEITHNYVRDNDWNVWFTITASDSDTLDNLLKWIEKFPGVSDIMNLPITRVYKINAVWGIPNDPRSPMQPDDPPAPPLDDAQRRLVRALQNDFPVLEHPFKLIGSSIGLDEEEVIGIVRGWVEDGTIRRFGARLNHRKSGYTTNILTVWRGRNVDQWGEKFARLDYVTHCYQRQSYQTWPYDLYTMVHARSATDMRKQLRQMSEIAIGAQILRLKTLYELKKTSMKYFMEE